MKRSYVSSPLKEPLMFETVPERIKRLADDDPQREAFVFYDFQFNRVPVTRKQLYNTSVKLGKVLASIGLKKGDRVAFCMNNSVEMLFANMATITAGGVPFYLMTNLKDGSDIIKEMTLMEPTLLIIDASVGDDNWKILDKIWPTDAPSCAAIPSLKKIICNGVIVEQSSNERLELSVLLSEDRQLSEELPLLDPEDILAYLVTSGSTGNPKNVAYTHFSLLNWTLKTNVGINMKESSVFFNDRQFSWAVGYPRTYLATGITRIFIDTRMTLSGQHIDKLAEIIEKEKCDVMYVPGYIAKDLIRNPQLAPKFKTVQSAILSGERVPKSSIALKNKFFKDLYTYYGTTETGGMALFLNEDIEKYEDGIIGLPVEGVEIKLVDENGVTVEFGKSGELCIRCPWRFVEYKGQDDLFHKVVDKANWYHSGDIAHFREDGNIVVEGREKEYVIIQTSKFFPWDVENALKDCPGAETVVVVGVPDNRFTNVFCACVVPKNDVTLTVDDVERYIDEVFLDEGTGGGITIKPTYCLIFEKLMLTSSGKISRRGIAHEAANRLSL